MAVEAEVEDAEAVAPAKKGISRKLLIIVGAALIVMLAAGAGLYFFVLAKPAPEDTHAEAVHEGFIFNLPTMTVNLNNDGADADQFMKLTVAIEVADEKTMTDIQPRMAKVVDAFQVYLRELRKSDLEGSAGIYRLKEELRRRVNIAIYPIEIESILFQRNPGAVMAGPSEQDKLSDDWDPGTDAASKPSPKAASGGTDDPSEWGAMLDADQPKDGADDEGGSKVLNQDEIDSLLGFDANAASGIELTGVQALINSALVSYERLPMLEIVFDRLVRLATTSLRNFTSDNVEVTLESISSVRFGDYLNSIPLPAVLSVFKAEEWDNYGLLTVDSSLIYSMIDVLLGGRRIGGPIRVEGRPYTTIEMALARRMIEVILDDTHNAFEPVTSVNFKLERMETNPRFAAISRPANAAILIELRIDMDDRGGKIEIMLPYATIEPIREQLLQMYMGEKFGRDPIWEGHLATELYSAEAEVEAVLHEIELPLSRVLGLTVGETVMLDRSPSDPIRLRCGDVELTEAIMGHIGDHVSVRITRPLNPPKVTMAAFEALDQHGEVR